MTSPPPTPAHAHGPVRTAIRDAARFDRAAVTPTAGLLAAIPVIAVLGIPIAAGDPVAGVTMGAGAMLVGIAWRATGGRPPVTIMAIDAVLMALATFTGAVTGHVGWLHILALVAWSLAGGLLVGLGNRSGAIGTQAIIAVVVFGRFAEPVGGALGLAGLVLAGGAAQVLFVGLVRWPTPLRAQRLAAADAYRELARLTTDAATASTLPAAAALDDAEASLASGSLFGDPAMMTLRSLVDEGYRVRLSLTAINGLAARLPDDAVAAVHAVAPDARRCLELAADVMQGGRAQDAAELRRCVERLSARVAGLAPEPSPVADGAPVADRGPVADGPPVEWATLVRRVDGLAGQLRAIAAMAPAAGAGGGLRSRRPLGRARRPVGPLRDDLGLLRANVSPRSPALRHAVRLAVIVPVAELIARELPLPRAYWMVVAAALVLRPEFGATLTRGTERAVGTSAGVAIAGLIAAVAHPAGAATVVLVGVLAQLGYATFPASFAVGFAFITALVVFLLNVLAPDTFATAGARLLDTLVGGTLGLLVFLAWPTWARSTAEESLVRLVGAQRAYLAVVLGAWTDGESIGAAQARGLARAARLARTTAESQVARSLSEPPARRLDRRLAQGLLGDMRRLVQVTHVLRLDAQEDRDRGPLPSLAPLASALDDLLGGVQDALAGDASPTPARPDVRGAQERFGAREARRHPELVAELDEAVDAANALADLAERREQGSISL